MTKTLQLNKNSEQGIRAIAHYLLDNKKVQAVFCLQKINGTDAVAYSLITDVKGLETAAPLYPLMPRNAGQLLSQLTLEGSPKKPLAVIIKPCEIRSFIELVKREQGSMDNLLIISATCGGVYPLKMAGEEAIKKHIASYWDAVKNAEIPSGIRKACATCTDFVPSHADIIVDIIGNKKLETTCLCSLHSKQAEQLLKNMDAKQTDQQMEFKSTDFLIEKRKSRKKKEYAEIEKNLTGMDGLITLFGKCIGCHGCSRVCPICYCKLCEFESPDAEYNASNYESELNRRGALKVPPGTLYFQIGRLLHIGISCVGCGSCEDVCPVNIPLSMIFKKVGEDVQNQFKYTPGNDVDEDVPLCVFKQDEFNEIGE